MASSILAPLFAASTTDKDDYKWRFSLTYVEIYNERVKDLLNPMSGCAAAPE